MGRAINYTRAKSQEPRFTLDDDSKIDFQINVIKQFAITTGFYTFGGKLKDGVKNFSAPHLITLEK